MIATWMLYAVAVSAVVGLAAGLVERAVSAAGGSLRWIWAIAFVVAVLVVAAPGPHLTAFLGQGSTDPGAGAPAEAVALAPEMIAGQGAAQTGLLSRLQDVLPGALDGWLLALWIAGAALLLAQWGRKALRTRRALRDWPPLDLPEGSVLVSEATGPAVVGVLGSRVVLPRWCVELPEAQRRLVMAHEQEHVRARDGLLVTGALVAACLVPWNVPFWAYLARLRDAVELDCDRRVMARHPGCERSYGELLLAVASRGPVVGLALATNAQRPSTLARRISMLTSNARGASRVRTLLLVAAGLLVVAVACLVPGPDRDGTSVTDPDAALNDEAALDAAELGESSLEQEPRFTPYTVAPEIRNREDVTRALERHYPGVLRDAGIGGTVVLHVFIDENGTLRNRAVAESSGHPSLDAAAMAVADEMQFSPAFNMQDRVPVWIQIPLIFRSQERSATTVPAGQAAEEAAGVEARATRDRMALPPSERPGQAPPSAAGLSREELQETPAFTPYTQAPEVLNRAEVGRALERSYPSNLRDAGVGGTAVVHFFIDETGTLQNVVMAESSGHEALDRAALEVASVFDFAPARNMDETVPVWIQVPIIFQTR